MITKTIKYTDYNGVEREETHYFNLTKQEVINMENSVNGGFSSLLAKIVEQQDAQAVMAEFNKLIDASYGQKSLDGRRFIKTPELLQEFKETEAYSEFIVGLLSDPDAALAFVNGIMPITQEDAQKIMAEQSNKNFINELK